jgi:hypothetical protein
LGYVIDFYLIGVLIFDHALFAAITAALLFVGFIGLWFVYPNWCRRKLHEGTSRP